MSGDQIWVKARAGHMVPLGPTTSTGDTTPPAPPSGLAATNLAANSVNLSWQPATDEVDHYDVWRQGTPNTRLLTGVTGTSVTVTGLTPATSYGLYLVAVDAAGNASAPSVAVQATTSGGTPPPTQTKLWVGFEAADPVDGTSETRTQTVNRVYAELSPTAGQKPRIVRCYSTPNARPATWSAVAEQAAVDADTCIPYWSTAASYSVQTSGTQGDPAYVSWLQAFVATLPAGSFLTTHHEWENDGVTAATWRTAYERFYDLVKAVRPDLQVGPVYMTYQWGTGRGVDQLGGPDACTPNMAKADFVGTDTYCMQSQATNPLRRLKDDTRHMRWHNHFKGYGLPLHLVERGLDHTGAYATAAGGDTQVDALIAQILLDDEQWMLTSGYSLYLYWQAKGGICELTTGTSRQVTYRAIASRGRNT